MWEAKLLDLAVGDEMEAPLGDAHDLRINRAHGGHRTHGVSQRTVQTAPPPGVSDPPVVMWRDLSRPAPGRASGHPSLVGSEQALV